MLFGAAFVGLIRISIHSPRGTFPSLFKYSVISSSVDAAVIVVNCKSGIEPGTRRAWEMCEKYHLPHIIFVTNMAQYAIKGYEVSAIDFIVKPVRYTSFAFKFGRAVDAASRKKRSRISVETREGLRYVDTADIVYVEVMGHKLIYHGLKGTFEAWGTMKAACAALEPFGFALCNACYLVNLSRVVNVGQDMVTVEGGDELKMSRGRKKSFMDALTKPLGS